MSSLAQTLHYPDIRPSWWPHLAQVHTSCAFECLCPIYNFSPICLVNVNLKLRILEAIQSDSVVISLSYLFDLFLLTLFVLYQESGHTRWSPMSCVMSLSMSEHCHHCQGTGPAVSGENKGNSPKISLKSSVFLSLMCVVWHLVYWWMMNSEGGIHNMPFLNGFIMKHNDLFVFCNT